jgi:hypothetical protein
MYLLGYARELLMQFVPLTNTTILALVLTLFKKHECTKISELASTDEVCFQIATLENTVGHKYH